MYRGLTPIKNAQSGWQIYRIIKTLKPEILHTHGFQAGFIARIIPGTFKRIHTYYAGDIEREASGKLGAIKYELRIIAEKFLANRCTLLVTGDSELAKRLQNLEIGLDQDWLLLPEAPADILLAYRDAMVRVAGIGKN